MRDLGTSAWRECIYPVSLLRAWGTLGTMKWKEGSLGIYYGYDLSVFQYSRCSNEWVSVYNFSCAFSWTHFLLLVCFVIFLSIILSYYIIFHCITIPQKTFLLSNDRQEVSGSRWEARYKGIDRSRGRRNHNQDILSERKIYFQ